MTDVDGGANGASQRSPRVFYGWWVVAANAVMSFYQAATYFCGFGAFINPLRQSFGWSYAQVSLAFSLRSAETGPIAPLTGAAVTDPGFTMLSQTTSLAMFQPPVPAASASAFGRTSVTRCDLASSRRWQPPQGRWA